MKLRKQILSLCVLFLLANTAIFAQDAELTTTESEDTLKPQVQIKSGSAPTGIKRGDQNLSLNLTMRWPLASFNPSTFLFSGTHTWPGAEFSLDYGYYIANNVSIGGSIGGSFNLTIAEPVLFTIPALFKVTYAFSDGVWQVPLSLGFGGVWEKLDTLSYFQMAIKPEAGLFYRTNASWSFGGTLGLLLIPELYTNASENRVGNILDVKLSAMYHL